MMMVVIAAVVKVVAMPRIASGSGVLVSMAHGLGGLREIPSLYDICAYVNICSRRYDGAWSLSDPVRAPPLLHTPMSSTTLACRLR